MLRIAEAVRGFEGTAQEETNGLGGDTAITYASETAASRDWFLRPVGRAFLIESKARPGRCLQALPNRGDQIPMPACNPNVPTQLWVFGAVGDKYVIAELVDGNRVIEAQANAVPVVTWFRDGGPRQLWTMKRP
ncbi:hypothetical protein ACIG5E_11645 [Kitasatospora sp. NPDC053057]|uniref:hypothetical protein n=1 Tax=Kitasatospora sp. NPDC053057 TaxID=3364062 RepID=UPI0037CC827D